MTSRTDSWPSEDNRPFCLALLPMGFTQPTRSPESLVRYRAGRISMIENLAEAKLSHCHCEILERLEEEVQPVVAHE